MGGDISGIFYVRYFIINPILVSCKNIFLKYIEMRKSNKFFY